MCGAVLPGMAPGKVGQKEYVLDLTSKRKRGEWEREKVVNLLAQDSDYNPNCTLCQQPLNNDQVLN